MMTEQLEKRFGTIAVAKGFITKAQLFESISVQLEQNLAGMEHSPVGSILYSLGYITISEIDEVLECTGIPKRKVFESQRISNVASR